MPTVLLHALPFDGSMWSDIVDTIGPAFAPDLYDRGNSVEAWAGSVLDECDPGPLVIVGNSVGGSCALELARLAPDRVRLLVLVGTKPGHRPEPALRRDALDLLAAEGLGAAWVRYWRPLFGPAVAPDLLDAARNLAVAQEVDAVARGVDAFHARADRTAFLASWPGRVVLVRGEHDPVARHDGLAARLHDARHVTVPGVGHYVPLEAPDALTEILREELRRALGLSGTRRRRRRHG